MQESWPMRSIDAEPTRRPTWRFEWVVDVGIRAPLSISLLHDLYAGV